MANDNFVYIGVRRDGCLGYFENSNDLPEGWRLAEQGRDITDVMQSLRADKAQALRVMNAHWTRYFLVNMRGGCRDMTTYAEKIRSEIGYFVDRERRVWDTFVSQSEDYMDALSLIDSDLEILERLQACQEVPTDHIDDTPVTGFLSVEIDGVQYVLVARSACRSTHHTGWMIGIMAFCVSDLSRNDTIGAGTTKISILSRADHERILDHLRSHRE